MGFGWFFVFVVFVNAEKALTKCVTVQSAVICSLSALGLGEEQVSEASL